MVGWMDGWRQLLAGGHLWRGPYRGVHSQCKTALGQAGMQWRVKVATRPGSLEGLIWLQALCPASLLVGSQQGGHQDCGQHVNAVFQDPPLVLKPHVEVLTS